MPQKIIFTDDQVKQIIDLRINQKKSQKEIGKMFNCSDKTIIRLLQKNNIKDVDSRKKYFFNERYFADIDSPDKAYWLGFLTADGYINNRRNTLKIHLGEKDIEHLKKFRKAIQCEDLPITLEVNKCSGKNTYILNVFSSVMVNDLAKHNVVNAKSGKEKPSEYVPKKFYSDYIRGFWDGDGYISDRKIGLCGSYDLMHWVQEQLHNIIGTPITQITFDSNIYRLYITATQIDVLKWLYPQDKKDLSLDRKFEKAQEKIITQNKKSLPDQEKATRIPDIESRN